MCACRPFDADAARDFKGPAEMQFTLRPYLRPASHARTFVSDSSWKQASTEREVKVSEHATEEREKAARINTLASACAYLRLRRAHTATIPGTTCCAAMKPSERIEPPGFMIGAKRCTHEISEYDDADIAAM